MLPADLVRADPHPGLLIQPKHDLSTYSVGTVLLSGDMMPSYWTLPELRTGH